MPHKRAKKSIREQQQQARITDQAPTPSNNINTEDVPKSIARVLNAAKVRSEWKETLAKRKREEHDGGAFGKVDGQKKNKKRRISGGDGGEKGKTKALAIQPGESLSHFNKRVEDDMRPLLNSAMQSSSVRKTKSASKPSKDSAKIKSKLSSKQTSTQTSDDSKDIGTATASRPTDFVKLSASTPRRLNDIVLAPPQLKKLPRGAARAAGKDQAPARSGIVSMSQKVMMETERENAIQRYRELKERRLKEKGAD